jgi:hypothetical protein
LSATDASSRAAAMYSNGTSAAGMSARKSSVAVICLASCFISVRRTHFSGPVGIWHRPMASPSGQSDPYRSGKSGIVALRDRRLLATGSGVDASVELGE